MAVAVKSEPRTCPAHHRLLPGIETFWGVGAAQFCDFLIGALKALGSEALPVFSRSDEGFDHLRVPIVAVELIELCQPKIIARVVCVRSVVRAAPQVAKELHQHECSVELLLIQ